MLSICVNAIKISVAFVKPSVLYYGVKVYTANLKRVAKMTVPDSS